MAHSLPRTRLFHQVAGVLVEEPAPFGAGADGYPWKGTLGTLSDNNVSAAWSEVRFSPDARWVAFGSARDSVVQIARFRPEDTPKLEVVLEDQLSPEPPALYNIRLGWSSDSRYLVAVSHFTTPRWWRFEPEAETVTSMPAGPGAPDIDWVAWSPGQDAVRGVAVAGPQRVRLHNRHPGSAR